MAAELHQAHLSLSPTEPPPAPLFPTSASILNSSSHSTITQEEAEEQRNTESTNPMAQYMHDHDHLSFQRGDYSEKFLSWHQPSMETQSGHLHEVPNHILNSFQNMSLVAKRPTLANHKPDHLNPLDRPVPSDNHRNLALQYNEAEKLMMRKSSYAYRKPNRPAPNFQQQQRRHSSSSGMRAVFLGSRMGSTGTGVFLPRTTYTESHTKPGGCSTVLIPARVAQALMVHFDKMEARSSLQGGFPPQHAGGRSGQYLFQQKSQPETTAPAALYDYDSIGLRLPQEWMY